MVQRALLQQQMRVRQQIPGQEEILNNLGGSSAKVKMTSKTLKMQQILHSALMLMVMLQVPTVGGKSICRRNNS